MNKPKINLEQYRFVVAELYQLVKMDGKFDLDHKKGRVVDTKKPISTSWYEKINRFTDKNGKFYLIYEQETIDYTQEMIDDDKRRKEVEKLKLVAGSQLANAIKSISEGGSSVKQEESKQEIREKQIAELELEKYGIPFKATAYKKSDENWNELISELKEEIEERKNS